MADVKWIKIVTDIFDDEKVLLIESMPEADSVIVIWFKLLCLAGKQNNNGVFLLNGRIPYTDKMFATIFRRKESTVRMALDVFESFGMVEIIDDTITIPNWDKHQSIDKFERMKAQNRERVARHREAQKALSSGNVTGNVTETLRNATDKIRIEEDKSRLEEDKSIKKTTRFTPPTLEEVEAYCSERGNAVDAQRFVDYYTSNGWMAGRNKMRDWKAAVRTWESNGYSNKTGKTGKTTNTAHPVFQAGAEEVAAIKRMQNLRKEI